MQNPYAHSTGPAPASPEARRAADYEMAIGPNAGNYLPKFEQFDKGGSKLGWHWPAFFVTTPWFLYRKMWGWGMGNLAYFWGILTFIAPIALGIAAGAAPKGGEMAAMGTVGIIIGILLLIPTILLPMFANALYWRHISGVIDKMPATIAQQPDKRASRITRSGGTGMGAMVGVLAGGAFLFLVIIGILAAIAIPAYQDSAIRAQVSEGMELSARARAAVGKFYMHNQAWPEDATAAGFETDGGRYVESVAIENGSVVVLFGGAAHKVLAGKTLILLPGLDETKNVAWQCANGEEPDSFEKAPGPSGTDLPPKYLPQWCRPAAGT